MGAPVVLFSSVGGGCVFIAVSMVGIIIHGILMSLMRYALVLREPLAIDTGRGYDLYQQSPSSVDLRFLRQSQYKGVIH